MIEQENPFFTHTSKELFGRILIKSTCKLCGASDFVSRMDGSLEKWEKKHKAEHEETKVSE